MTLPLVPPPRDSDGNALPHDHSGVQSTDTIIRRIAKQHVVDGKTPGTKRISSMAFNPSSGANGGMSVDVEKLIVQDGLNSREFVMTDEILGAVEFSVGAVRALEFQVGYDPIPDKNPYHAEVWGRFSSGDKRKLQRIARWHVEIGGVTLSPD